MCKATAGNYNENEAICLHISLHPCAVAHHTSFSLFFFFLVYRTTLKPTSRSCYTRDRTFEDFTHYKNCTQYFVYFALSGQ